MWAVSAPGMISAAVAVAAGTEADLSKCAVPAPGDTGVSLPSAAAQCHARFFEITQPFTTLSRGTARQMPPKSVPAVLWVAPL